MELLDSRRLTGANCISDRAGAVIDIDAADAQIDAVIAAWTDAIRHLLDDMGWAGEATFIRRCAGGVSLVISAPIDALYAATEINECAWNAALRFLRQPDTAPADWPEAWTRPQVARLRELVAGERRPELPALQRAAAERQIAFFQDDDCVSLGMGNGSRSWDVSQLPAPAEIDWDNLHDIPVGLVTGTNGKTTSVRMAAAVAQQAGLVTGYSSTDSITIDEQVVDTGDYAGPEGARTILRNARVEIAILETARGGLLRRGVNTPRATAALLTRIARDHIGDFGSRNLQELLDIKWVVTRSLDSDGRLVLNADDPMLVEKSQESPAPVVFFSLDSANPVIVEHVAGGGQAWTLHRGHVARRATGRWHTLVDVKDIPLTLNGAARHNVANALGVAALCSALGIADTDIIGGLKKLDARKNPGRGNLFEIGGVRVLVDFAHNPDAFRAIVDTSLAVAAKRRLIAFGEAGDRTDELIRDLARTAWRLAPDRIITLEIAKYARGRKRGEIAGLLHDEFVALGAGADQISHHESELDALKDALDWAEPGDMIILLALAERDEVLSYLQSCGSD